MSPLRHVLRYELCIIIIIIVSMEQARKDRGKATYKRIRYSLKRVQTTFLATSRLSIRLFYLVFSINGDKRIWKFSTTLSTVFNPITRLNANENYVVSKYLYTIRNSF